MTDPTEPRTAAQSLAVTVGQLVWERQYPGEALPDGYDEHIGEVFLADLAEHGLTIEPPTPGRVVIDASDARWIDSHLCAALHMQPEGEYRTEMDGVWRRVMVIVDQPATIAPPAPGRVVIPYSALERFEAWAARIPQDEWATEDRYAFAALQDAIAAERTAGGGA